MMGTTLAEIRARIESLASADGAFVLRCARTGERPVPADGYQFPDRERAATAARATAQYRAALRRYDPRLPCHDVIVTQRSGAVGTTEDAVDADEEWAFSPPVVGRSPAVDADRSPGSNPDDRRISFCHDVAAATFEALSAGGHEAVEDAVVDAYLALAERVEDRDDLCLCLLESMAAAMDDALVPRTQAAVLTGAADRLGPIDDGAEPLAATLARLERLGLVESGSHTPWSIDDRGRRTAVLELEGYALDPSDDGLPVLPIVLDLYRRRFDRHLTRVRAARDDDGWTVTMELGRLAPSEGVVRAPFGEVSEA